MNKMIFVKAFSVAIIVLFVGTSLVPMIESSSIRQNRLMELQNDGLPAERSVHSDEIRRRRPDGIAPKTKYHQQERQIDAPLTNLANYYAYNAYDPGGGTPPGPISFNEPGDITLLAPGVFPNFCAGSDNTGIYGDWYGCDYAGGLYLIDTFTGSQTYIANTISVNAMTYDVTTNTWYVSNSNGLYIMDVTNGQTTLIGSHEINNIVIGLACDSYGNMFAYDVLWTGESTLYSVNKDTGECTAIGSMGYGFIYAQGCDYNDENAAITIAGYFNDGSPSALLTCDTDTGEATIIANFAGGMEVDGLVAPSYCPPPHDIAIQKINAPSSGNAMNITPEVRVANYGAFVEDNVSINLCIGKEQINGTVEDFEATNGSYIHFAKLTDSWQWGVPNSGPGAAYSGSNLWATVLEGAYPNNMWCGLISPDIVVPSGAMFKFWNWYDFESGWDGGNVKISTDGGTTYTIITPEGGYPGTLSSNPYMTGQPGYTGQGGASWNQAMFDLSTYEGMTVKILFETASDSSVTYPGWYIDDVGFSITSYIDEYNQTVTIPIINPSECINVTFPEWTPADLGSVENLIITYKAEALNLHDDQNPYDDYKQKDFTLHYGYFHDVAVTEIISPKSGLAKTQTPEVMIENHGQNAENINVQMTIGKAIFTTLIEEVFAGGVPPAGWGTNYPSNWYSSSTNYAGGVAPEAEFSWTPSSVGEHLLWTSVIDTTGYTALGLKFKEYVNDYNSNYVLKVVTSTDGGASWQDAYTRTGGPYGPTTTEVALTAANGIGSATFQVAWDMSGDSFNINYWYIDDVWMGIIDIIQEYNATAAVDISPGEITNVTLPAWTPAEIPFSFTIDYLINASVSINVSDGDVTDNYLNKLITLSFEHDFGVIEITKPGDIYQPGVYPVEGIIQNLGVTYSETDIPVNTIITNDTGVVVYNETEIIVSPLAPGATAIVIFPNINIPWEPASEGDYKLVMKTDLIGDDHPENDKKIHTWVIWSPDTTPPTTTATVSGTMGQNNWYVSDVQVTLTATDGKWPSGVNQTYYSVNDPDPVTWDIYVTPIVVDDHCFGGKVYFYSDDRAIPPNVEEVKNVSFKIDQDPPEWTEYTFLPQNIFKDIWLCRATVEDYCSGLKLIEFYVDDALVGSVDAPGPYEFEFNGKPTTNSYAIAYDAAGNSALGPIVQYVELNYQSQSIAPRALLMNLWSK